MRIDLFCLPLLNKRPRYDVWQLLELLWSWLAGGAVRCGRVVVPSSSRMIDTLFSTWLKIDSNSNSLIFFSDKRTAKPCA